MSLIGALFLPSSLVSVDPPIAVPEGVPLSPDVHADARVTRETGTDREREREKEKRKSSEEEERRERERERERKRRQVSVFLGSSSTGTFSESLFLSSSSLHRPPLAAGRYPPVSPLSARTHATFLERRSPLLIPWRKREAPKLWRSDRRQIQKVFQKRKKEKKRWRSCRCVLTRPPPRPLLARSDRT